MMKHIVSSSLILLAVSGCVSNPPKLQSDGQYATLYDGKPTVAYATELPTTTAKEAIIKGDHALRSNDADMALFYYVQALRHNNKDPATFYKIGLTHSYRGNDKLAALAYRETLRLAPEHTRALEGLGLIELDHRQYDSAKELMIKVVKADPTRWKSLNALGVIADLNGDHNTAQTYYHSALNYVPNATNVLNNLGYSKYLSGNWGGAIRDFRHILNIDPQHKRTWMNLGLVYTRRGQYSDAVDAFQRVMSEASAYNNVGFICMTEAKNGNGETVDQLYDLSEQYFLKAIKTSPKYYITAHKNLAKLRILRYAGPVKKDQRTQKLSIEQTTGKSTALPSGALISKNTTD